MEYLQHQLPNGLTVLAEVNPLSHIAAFGVFVKAGARDETPEISGVSHFLEHMVFKGTPTRSAAEVNQLLDEIGSHSNARTGEESTIYHATVLPEFQSQVVELLCDLMRPSLRVDDFETEKKVIIEEIKMYADQPPYGGYEQIMENFFGSHPLGLPVLGTEESVGQMSPEQMLDYFHQRYSPGNMAIAAAGNVDFKQLVDQVESLCGDWSPFDAPRTAFPNPAHTGINRLLQPNSTQQYLMQMANGTSSHEPSRYASRVMATIFGGDGGSRMYWEFLDNGLAESAGMGGHEFQDAGAMMTFICCHPDNTNEALMRLQTLQLRAQQDGFTADELELAQRKIAAAMVMSSERTERRMFAVGSQWLVGRPYRTTAEIVSEYENVSLDQVNQVLQRFPLHPNMTLSVGPRDDLSMSATPADAVAT